MKQLSSIDIFFLMKELKVLDKGKLNKIFSRGKKYLILDIYSREAGKVFLVIEDCKYIHLSSTKKETGEPSGFCMFLRKHLKNGIIAKIEQIEGERIIKLEIERKGESAQTEGNVMRTYNLYLEFFAKGNIILCDENDKIIALSQKQALSGREIRVHTTYEIPRGRLNFTKLSEESLIRESKDEEIVKVLASKFSMGGVFGEEICARAGIDKNTQGVDQEASEKIVKVTAELLKEELNPTVIYKESGDVLIVTPIHLKIYEDHKKENVGSFSLGFEKVLGINKREVKESKKLSRYNEEIARIKKKIEDQEEHIENLGEVGKKNKEKGDKIYENYSEISELIAEVNSVWKEKGFEEVKKKVKSNKMVKNINPLKKLNIAL
jgi:predicted ribosome quality control (RQC) complex YloA/Tae2 family protein